MLAQPRKIRLVARQAEAVERELLAMRLQRATAQYDIGETHPNRLREQLALRCLGLAGYETYFPRLREHRISHGRRIEIRPPLFPGYCFLTVEAQWYAARWSIGVIGLIMDGIKPACRPDHR